MSTNQRERGGVDACELRADRGRSPPLTAAGADGRSRGRSFVDGAPSSTTPKRRHPRRGGSWVPSLVSLDGARHGVRSLRAPVRPAARRPLAQRAHAAPARVGTTARSVVDRWSTCAGRRDGGSGPCGRGGWQKPKEGVGQLAKVRAASVQRVTARQFMNAAAHRPRSRNAPLPADAGGALQQRSAATVAAALAQLLQLCLLRFSCEHRHPVPIPRRSPAGHSTVVSRAPG